MKHKFFIILLLIIFIIGALYFFVPKTIDTLPNESKVKSVLIQMDEQEVRIEDDHIITKILDDMKSAKKTMKSSNNDQPIAGRYTTTVFERIDGQSDTFYFYELKGEYYIEKPYEGIYKSTKNIQENIVSYFLNNE